MDIDELSKRKTRINQYTKKAQFSTTTIISNLKKMKHDRRQENPNDQELFSIGVTVEDIYSKPNDNFVYGCASMQDGIGIYSFARLDPLFPNVPENRPCTEEEKVIILKRAISIFIHEVTHLFGLEHCICYLCLMNGAEHKEEMDKQQGSSWDGIIPSHPMDGTLFEKF
jgi:archaemetzincin